MALETKQYHYRVGFFLYFVSFALSLCSIATPSFWIYERERPVNNLHNGRSVWNFDINICTSSDQEKWCCQPPTSSAEGKLMAAACLLFVGILTELVACLLLVFNNRRNSRMLWAFLPEIVAGIACQINVTGILIYTSVTFRAVNLIYGLGFSLNIAATLLGYLGLLLTGLHAQDLYKTTSISI